MGGGWGSGPVRQAQSKRIRQPHGAHPLIAIAVDRDDGRIAEIAQHPAIGARRDELDAVEQIAGQRIGGDRADRVVLPATRRSEESRVGKECVSTCSSRWSPNHYKKNNNISTN